MRKSKIFDLIDEEIESAELKKQVRIQFIEDKWSSYSELETLIESNALNEFDFKVAKVFLCRGYSLTYKYGLCFDIISECDKIKTNLIHKNNGHLALLGYMYHQFAISLGYMGKRKDSRYDDFIDKANQIYDELGIESEKADLIIQSIDLDYYYYDPLGIPDLIDRYKLIPEKFYDEKGIFFRLGVINLMGYLRTDRTTLLNDSIIYLKKQLNKSGKDHYRNYLATCALIIAQKANNEMIIKLPDPPPGARSKSEKFPLFIFILLRAFRISGENNKSRRLLFNIERKLKNLIACFEDPDYKKFIFVSYGFVIEEWMLSVYEDTELSMRKKFYHIIHVNEIIQNRLLADELHSYLPKQDGLINVKEILHKIAQEQPDTGLVYITSTIRNLKNEKHFFILNADKINDEKTFSINEIKSKSLWGIENQFREKIL
ncbi:uncharacterized protein METZ01_LOCUS230639, partial [marine metagenome]